VRKCSSELTVSPVLVLFDGIPLLPFALAGNLYLALPLLNFGVFADGDHAECLELEIVLEFWDLDVGGSKIELPEGNRPCFGGDMIC
jgi:hypothetical protein